MCTNLEWFSVYTNDSKSQRTHTMLKLENTLKAALKRDWSRDLNKYKESDFVCRDWVYSDREYKS